MESKGSPIKPEFGAFLDHHQRVVRVNRPIQYGPQLPHRPVYIYLSPAACFFKRRHEKSVYVDKSLAFFLTMFQTIRCIFAWRPIWFVFPWAPTFALSAFQQPQAKPNRPNPFKNWSFPSNGFGASPQPLPPPHAKKESESTPFHPRNSHLPQ